MNIFCFNPKHNRESLQEFNDRVQEFCLDSGAVGVEAMAVGGYLMLKVLTLDGMDGEIPEGMPTVMPSVRKMDADDKDWEEQIISFCEQEEAKATEDDPVREVADVKVISNEKDITKGWAILTVITGEVEQEELPVKEGEQEEEEQEPQEEQQTGGSITPGFNG